MAKAEILIALSDQKRAQALVLFFSESQKEFNFEYVNIKRLSEVAEHKNINVCIFDGETNLEETFQVFDLLNAKVADFGAKCIICFDDAQHLNRPKVAQRRIIDYVFQSKIADLNLLALIERLIGRQLISSKLDFTSQQFQMIVENSNDGIYVFQDSSFVYVNPKLESMLGYTAEELCSPNFPLEKTIAAESRDFLAERFRKLNQGIPVPSRYQLKALNKNNRSFDVEVSISYLDFQGHPSSLGVMQDITERKRYEKEFIRKNRELALLNDVSDAINNARSLQEILETGSRRLFDLLNLAAIGISLLDMNDEHLELRASIGLTDILKEKLQVVHRNSSSLLAEVIRNGETKYIADIDKDERIHFENVRKANYQSVLVVPLKAQHQILGVAFIFSPSGVDLEFADRKLMYAVGVLLGTAIRKAGIFEKEKAAVKTLSTIDSIAKSISSRLEINEVATQLGEHLKTLFQYDYLAVAKYSREKQSLCTIHRNEKNGEMYHSESFIGAENKEECFVVDNQNLFQSLKSKRSQVVGGEHSCLKDCSKLMEMKNAQYKQFIITPIFSKDNLLGLLFLAFKSDQKIEPALIQTLEGSASYMAIAMKNAELFAGRNRALIELKSAQKKLRQSEQLRALGEMAAGVAHDFNNVLSVILGRAQLLKNTFTQVENLDSAWLKHAEIIEQAALDGAETVHRIQEIGKQKGTESFKKILLFDILEDVFEYTKPKWKSENHSQDIKVTLENIDDDIWVHANPHELREVLVNFVHNAIDAMCSTGELRLSLEQDVQKKCCFIHIEDTGPGIPEELRSKIFEPFFTTKGDQGTGLGLSVSLSIIERHQGELEMVDEKRQQFTGAHFVISLPYLDNSEADDLFLRDTTKIDQLSEKKVQSTDQTQKNRSAFSTGSKSASSNDWEQEWTNGSLQHLPKSTIAPQILVIDDEENIRELISDFLTMEQCQVMAANDGKSGLQLARTLHFDFIFTDLSLPDMTGIEVLEQLKQENPDVPVCLVTGWQGQEDDARKLAEDFDYILNKPFKVEDLLSIIRHAIHKEIS